MFSSETICDSGDGGRINSEGIRHVLIGRASHFHETNGLDVIISQFADTGAGNVEFDRVGMIADAINPFEVRHNADGLHTIDVVDLRQICGVWDECSSHQTMDGSIFVFRGITQVDGRIASIPDTYTEQTTFEVTRPDASDSMADHRPTDAINASDISEIADLIEVSEVGQRYRAPFFGDPVIHEVGPVLMLASAIMARTRPQTQ